MMSMTRHLSTRVRERELYVKLLRVCYRHSLTISRILPPKKHFYSNLAKLWHKVECYNKPAHV
jgi:hypothetical protein